jgi:sulfate/thiosulfate transport system permease protein
MTVATAPPAPGRLERPPRTRRVTGTVGPLAIGVSVLWLSIIVLLPLAALTFTALSGGLGEFWDAVTAPSALAALRVTLGTSAVVALVNVVMGTLVAWVLVRDDFPGKSLVNALIDLPFALPTIVAGLTLLALYGPKSPLGVNVAYTRIGLLLALLFVTLPFVVRAVQPVLLELDREMEEAAASLGAGGPTIFRRIVLPNLLPAILSGVALGFARSLGEFGSVVLISGNIPFKTEVASVFIFGQVESSNVTAAAAVSVVLMALALMIMLVITALSRWRSAHDR